MTIDRHERTWADGDLDGTAHEQGGLDGRDPEIALDERDLEERDSLEPVPGYGDGDAFDRERDDFDRERDDTVVVTDAAEAESLDSTDHVAAQDPFADPTPSDTQASEDVSPEVVSSEVVSSEVVSPEVASSEDVPSEDGVAAAHVLSAEWQSLQGRFVDDPDAAVSEAAALVDDLIQQLQQSLHGSDVEDGEVSTEQKRLAFQRYRALHDALTKV